MLKQTVTYTDYNDEVVVEDLFFNLSRTELMDMLDLQPRLEAWRASTQVKVAESEGPTSPEDVQLSTDQVRELLEILKILIEKSYGVRSEDGKRFRKSRDIFLDFKDSPAYDELIFTMFTNPDNAVRFMTGIMPAMLAEEIRQAIQDVELPKENVQTDGEQVAVGVEAPAWMREDRDPTPHEIIGMSRAEMQEAFKRKSSRREV